MRKYDPFYWVTDLSKTFLSRDYLSPGETVQSRLRDISTAAELYLNKPGFGEKFYDYMSRGWYSLATPVWTNFGKKRGMPVSCFNSHVTDDIGGILYAQGEVGMMSKIGGGTSGYFGDVRPRGSDITDNGKSTGVVHFLELFQSTTNVISQGSARRGRMAPYLPIDHGDIEEFLAIGSDNHPIQDMNSGVIVDSPWMQSMIDGDSDKRRIWGKLLQARKETGYPYLMFRTNANDQAPEVFRDKNLTINSSNLCVTGDTLVLTREGYKPIDSLAGLTVDCWNGQEWSSTPIFQTSEGQHVVTVELSNGQTVQATPYHKWYVGREEIELRTIALQSGDLLTSFTDPEGNVYDDVYVVSVTDDSVVAPTYCGTEPIRNRLMFNGVLTGNCNEIYLPSTPDESFTCILSSMNLLHYDEWKDTDAVETLVYFLDAVATEFITKLEAYRDSPNRDDQLVWEYMKRAHRFTVNNRA
jgi:ribonucleotide reductase alpha subunit